MIFSLLSASSCVEVRLPVLSVHLKLRCVPDSLLESLLAHLFSLYHTRLSSAVQLALCCLLLWGCSACMSNVFAFFYLCT